MVVQLFATRYQLLRLTNALTVCFVCLVLTSGSIVWAQDVDAQQEPKPVVTAKVDQAKLVRSIYELTKTSKTAKQLTEFVAKCDSTLEYKLTDKNTQYVTSLKGWALNLRGQKRMAVGLQFKQIGNSQADSIIKQAMEDFDQAILSAPDRYRSWMSRGVAFAQTGEFDKAALNFTSVIKLKTDLADGWFNRAESLYHLGRFEAAISDYDTVLRLQSDDAQALTGLGHSKLALGKSAEALQHYQAVAKLQSESPNVYINIGDAFQQLKDWESARSNFDKSISIKPTSIALQRSAWLKATCPDESFRDPAEAVKLAQQAIGLTGDSVVNLDTLAAALAAQGKFDVAKTTQQKTIALASAVEDVDSEVGSNMYQARLTLYEEEQPYTQSETATSDSSRN